MNGLTAYTCPDTEYLHRTNFNKSYYIREYESGKANYNWFLILSEFLYIFNDKAKDFILSFNIQGEKNLFTELCAQENVLATNYIKYLVKNSKTEYVSEIKKKENDLIDMYDCYWLAMECAQKEKYDDALSYFRNAYIKGLRHPEQFRKILSQEKKSTITSTDSKQVVNEIITPEIFILRGSKTPIFKRIMRKLIRIMKRHDFIFDFATRIYWLYLSSKKIITESSNKKKYYSKIEHIKKDKVIIVDFSFGGLGDCLIWSTLPRLLKEKYNVDFYLSEQSLSIIRNKDIFKLCFAINPFYKGVKKEGTYFSFETFESEKSFYTFLTNKEGKSVIELLEKQFNLSGNGKPEIYYKPKIIDSFQKTIYIDKNFITGKKLGWIYRENSFENEARQHMGQGDILEYADQNKQDLFGYIDKIYSCKYFVCTFSGGASIAACFDKPFSVIWPSNGKNGSNYQFRYKKSAGRYV